MLAGLGSHIAARYEGIPVGYAEADITYAARTSWVRYPQGRFSTMEERMS